MDIKSYIHSGIIEEYAMGLSSEEDSTEFEYFLNLYPELQQALYDHEVKLEEKAREGQIPPPPHVRKQINDVINKLPEKRPAWHRELPPPPVNGTQNGKSDYITAQAVPDTHIRVHKYWRTILFILFVVAKILIGTTLFFAIKYYDAQTEVKRLQEKLQNNATIQAPR